MSSIPADPSKRVLVIGPTPPPYNGMTTAIEAIMRSNLNDRFQLIHLDSADRRGIANIGTLDFWNIWLALRHSLELLFLLARYRPHVLYIPIAQAPLGYLRDGLWVTMGRLFHSRVIVHLHGGFFRQFYETSSRPMRWYIRHTVGMVDRAIVLGYGFRHIFNGLLPDEKIAVVPNGLPADTFAAVTDAAAPKPRRVLFVGALLESKGYLDILRAAPRVLRALPDTQFVFAGEIYSQADWEQAQAIISQHKIEHAVFFMGVAAGEKKAKLFQSSQVFVLPTFYPFEGQPFVILEAMAAGLPVVATRHGVIDETVEDGVTGRLVPQHDADTLAEVLIDLLQNDAERDSMGNAGRQRFLQLFTVDHYIDRLAANFATVAGRR